MLKWTDVLRFANHGNPIPDKRVEKSESEWKNLLSPAEFQILRQKGTEGAYTGQYCEAHDPGLYACKGCKSLLFDSQTKFDSRSGWPSFTQPVKENVIKYEIDTSYGMKRIEVMCNVCDGHLGHVFPDGPPPSGLRYCINSASIEKVEEKP